MKKLLVTILIGGLLFSSCAAKQSLNNNNDDIYNNDILGSWIEGDDPYGISTFKEGGIYYCEIWKSPKKEKLIATAEGKWWIANGRLYNTVHKVDPPIFPPTDKPIIDIIVNISDNEMTLIDSRKKKYKKTRIN